MKIEYDSETDGAYLWLMDKPESRPCDNEVWPKEFNEEIGFLFNKNGKIIGIECLKASYYLASDLLKDTYHDEPS